MPGQSTLPKQDITGRGKAMRFCGCEERLEGRTDGRGRAMAGRALMRRLRVRGGGVLLAFAALLALPNQVAAQTGTTLVSNAGQTLGSSSGSIQTQPFTTGDNASGYTLTGVNVGIGFPSDIVRTFRIVPSASNGEPDLSNPVSFITLTNPGTITADALNTFTAPTNATLATNTTYHLYLVSTTGNPGPIQRIFSTDEDSGSAAGWSIGNARYVESTDSWSIISGSPVRMQVNGTAITGPASTVATLASLAVNDGTDDLTLTPPTFVSGTDAYAASVANAVTTVTLMAMTTDNVARISRVTLDGIVIADRNFSDGIMVPSLVAGDNEIKVTVTAQDTTTRTYTVTVTRAAPPPPARPRVLVSNTGQDRVPDTTLRVGDFDQAQRFRTGDHADGYTLSAIDVRVSSFLSGSSPDVAIHRTSPSLNPGHRVFRLSNPAPLRDGAINTFTAPPGAQLDPNTNYFVMFKDTESGANAGYFLLYTASNAEDPRAASGWRIDDGSRAREQNSSVWTSGGNKFQIAVNGTANNTVASDDAMLSALTVNDGTDDLTLTPTFVSGTDAYAADIAGDVTTVTLIATTTDAAAEVSAVTLGGTEIADTDFSDGITVPSLVTGANVIVVTVTAEDTSTETYTVTVTRAVSTDATLSVLTVDDGTSDHPIDLASPLPLDVANDVDTVTLTALVNHAGATVSTVTLGGNDIGDSDFSDGIITVSDLVEGDNTIVVTVTAENGAAMETYTVMVTRGVSDDATLSRLTVSDGTNDPILTPAFAAGMFMYAADVGNAVDAVTLSATTTHPGAMASAVTLGGTAIADSNFADGITVSPLVDGDNVIVVTVTAADTTTMQDYTLTVTRAEPTPPADVLVSNTGQDISGSRIVGASGGNQFTTAQQFTTGDSAGGYTLSAINVSVDDFLSDSSPRVSIYTATSGNPGTLLFVLSNPATLRDGTINTFTAPPAPPFLTRGTDYFVVFEDTGSGADAGYGLKRTIWPFEDAGKASGWSIADSLRLRDSDSAAWALRSSVFKIAVRGTAVASDDATLSGLTVADASDDSAITLAPPFAAGTVNYAVSVENAVTSLTITPMLSDSNATVAYFYGNDVAIPDDDTNATGHQVALDALLSADEPAIFMTVTAQDTTTRTYTVTVTRHAPLLTPPADAVWSAVLTPVTFSDVLGCTITTDPSQVCSNPATLSEDSFTHDSVDYTITSLNTFFSPTAGTSLGRLDIQFDTGLTTATQALILVVDGDEYPFIDADNMTALGRQWENTGLDATWPAGVPVAVWLVEPPSDDATLSDLSLANASDGTAIPLNETFVPTLITYTANVLNDVTSITITPERSDDVNAAFEIQNDSGMMITDADTNTTGLQVALDVGETVIKVKVTAEDMSTETYTVTVTRAMAVTPPADALVSNTGQTSHNNSRVVGVSGALKLTQAQQFTTGDNAGGYTLSAIDVLANDFKLLSSPRVRIYTTTSGNPGTPLYVLTNPGTLADDAINTFTAPSGATLDPATGYFVVFEDTASGASSGYGLNFTDNNAEDSGAESDWGIADDSWLRNMNGAVWASSNDKLQIAVRGTVNATPPSTDAMLSGLTVNDGTNDLTLAPAFASGTFIYTADVANAVDEVTLTAMRADDGAVVSTVTLGGTGIADTDFNDGIITVSDLVEGPNIIVVTVTAEDTTTMQPYTVTVTRAMPPPPPPAGVEVPNNWSLIPSGLGAGDGFRLIFLSSTKRNGSATDIATYNTFVQDRATAGHTDIQTYSPGFRVVGCTPDTDARDNTATTGAGVPIYWLDGNKIADDYADFYDGTWDDEANDKNESGTDGPDTSMTGNYPLTGCDDDGTESFSGSASLGLGGLGASFVRVGRPDSNILSTHGPLSSLSSAPNTANRPMYGLSQVFTVAASTAPPLLCGRTQVVIDAILGRLSGVTDCADVTDAHLASIRGPLSLISKGITELAPGDFAGLTGVTLLSLNGNELTTLPAGAFAGLPSLKNLFLSFNDLTGLPADVFDGLTALTELYLSDNALEELPAGVFDGLVALEVLGLPNNDLTMLPANVFDDLAALTILDLSGNGLTALPAGVFDELTALTELSMGGNALTTLPANVFDELTALETLGLSGNALTALPDGVFAPLTVLTTLDLSGNPGAASFVPTAVALPDDGTVPPDMISTVTLDGSDGGPWGDNVTYGWALTDPASGTIFDAVTFAPNNTDATPVVTIPALAEDTVLVFTLTVTGRGATATATDTATVTAIPLSDDAMLSALTLADASDDSAVALTPAFMPDTLTYTAPVANDVGQITLTPTLSDDTAMVAYLDASDTVIDDANMTTPGFQVALTEGANEIRVRVTAEDDSTTQTYMLTVTRAANTPATGAPVISGTAQVGEVLTATTGGIADADGLPGSFTWQWLRVDSDSDGVSNETMIGANAATYTLAEADEGARIRVRVSFTDDAGNPEALTSAAWPSSGMIAPSATPLSTDATLRALALAGANGGAIPLNQTFAPTLTAYTADVANGVGQITLTPTLSDDTAMVAYLDASDTVIDDANMTTPGFQVALTEGANEIRVRVTAEDDSTTQTYMLTVTRAANTPATGAPVISGTAQVGEVLTATTGGIADADGLPGSFTWQWLRVDSDSDGVSNETMIGANAATYTLAEADEGARIKVRVSFIDNAGNPETRTSAATGAVIAAAIPDRTAPVAAWLPRFGRTVSEQVVEAAQARMAATPVAGLAGQLAGQMIAIAPGRGSAEARADAEADFAALGESFFGAGNATGNAWDDIGDGRDGAAERGYSSRALTGRDFLTGSAFALTGDGGDSAATLWGRGAVTSFDGRDGSLSLDGEVVSGMLGIDWRNGERSGGLMLSRSRGEGDYRSSAAGGATSDDGRISATLTGLYPWLGHRVNDRLTLWGVAGYGRGTLTLTPAGEDALSAGIGLTMGSVGARGALGAGAEGVVLAWEADALALRTTSDAASGAEGRLDATSSGVTRVRLGLTGSRRFRLGSGAVLTPGLEVGLRHDGGDAETGFGTDIGVSLDFADPARGITAAVSARGLLDHAAQGFRERGLSATLTWDQRPGSDLGWSLSLGHGVGAATEGGAASLLARQSLAGLLTGDGDDGDDTTEGNLQRRFDATLGYGVPMAAGRLVAISGIGFGLTDAGREYSVGWRLGLARSGPMDLHLGLEATRQESTTGSSTHDLGLDLGAAIRW